MHTFMSALSMYGILSGRIVKSRVVYGNRVAHINRELNGYQTFICSLWIVFCVDMSMNRGSLT